MTIEATRSTTVNAVESGNPSHNRMSSMTPVLPSAVSDNVSTLARNSDTRAVKSDSLVLTNPGSSSR